MLQHIHSSDKRFKAVVLGPGLNIIVADKTNGSVGTDTRNGVGKSSIVEILHFLLGARSLTGSVLANSALQSLAFTLKLDWPPLLEGVSVTRALGPPPGGRRSLRSRVLLEPDVLVAEPSELVREATIPEWVDALGERLFGLPGDDSGLSARGLLSLYIRRVSQGGFADAVKTFPTQAVSEASTNVAYLLGLNWRLASGYKELAGRETVRQKLLQAMKDPSFSFIVGSVSELRGLVASATARTRSLQSEVAAFRVVPEYEGLQQQADAIDTAIRRTRAQDAADRRNLIDLESAIQDEHDPDVGYLERAYGELGIVLPQAVLRRYQDVQEFHNSVLANRRAYLAEEIASTSARLAGREAERASLGEQHAGLLRALDEGGALGAFTVLQEQLAAAQTELSLLLNRLETARALEATQAEIKFERSRLQQEITRDLAEREPIIEEINLLFQRFAAALYGAEREAYIEFVALDTSLRITPHIGRADSRGIGQMIIFCFDLTVAVIAHRAGRGPDFLVHDSHLFDGVDERQVGRALLLAQTVCGEESLQYVVTLNSDDLQKVEDRGASLQQFIVEPRLTDAYDDGGLFGFSFD